MIKKIAWDTFKNTGNIDAYLELKQIEMIENQINNQSKQLIDNANIELDKNIESNNNQKVD